MEADDDGDDDDLAADDNDDDNDDDDDDDLAADGWIAKVFLKLFPVEERLMRFR